MTPKDKYLFPEIHPSQYGESYRRRNLFLPRNLKAKSIDERLKGESQDQAHKIILKWADMESSGKLEEQKETAIEGEFLKDVFGDGLGYKLFSDSEETWNLKAKFTVDGTRPLWTAYKLLNHMKAFWQWVLANSCQRFTLLTYGKENIV